jgi:hypothetical protein
MNTHLGLMTRFLSLSDSCGFVDVGRSLWQEARSVIYNCCWLSPVQSFSSLNLVALLNIFYGLRFETSLSTASYNSQGYGAICDNGNLPLLINWCLTLAPPFQLSCAMSQYSASVTRNSKQTTISSKSGRSHTLWANCHSWKNINDPILVVGTYILHLHGFKAFT